MFTHAPTHAAPTAADSPEAGPGEVAAAPLAVVPGPRLTPVERRRAARLAGMGEVMWMFLEEAARREGGKIVGARGSTRDGLMKRGLAEYGAVVEFVSYGVPHSYRDVVVSSTGRDVVVDGITDAVGRRG